MSRRFKSRHARVQANPKALPSDPVELDDDNSYVDPTQSDRRIPHELNRRHYARAESAVAAELEAAKKAALAAAKRKLDLEV